MKRILSIFICISMLVVVLPMNIYAMSGTGTESTPYLVASASDLNAIRNDLDGYYKLTCDIDMNGVNFTPIGNESEGAFTGTIDGAGYSIKNLNLHLPEEKYVGLVGYLEGTAKNINLVNVNANGYRYVGGIVGYADEFSVVDNCIVTGTISGTFQVIELDVGGICGKSVGEIRNCTNYSTVSSNGGSSYDTICSGGIVGSTNGFTYNNVNTGDVLSQNAYYPYSGGIAGVNNGKISKCLNIGNISSSCSASSSNGSPSYEFYAYAGGVSGSNKNSIELCENHGYVYSYGRYNSGSSWLNCNRSGGIAGYNIASIKNCANYSNVESNAYYTYNGRIDNGASGCFVGNYGTLIGTVENCFNIGKNNSGTGTSNISNCYNEQILTYRNLSCVDFSVAPLDYDNIWYMDSDINSGLPQLRDMPRHLDLSEYTKWCEVGKSVRLSAFVNGQIEDVVWQSDNLSVASITDDGLLAIKGSGSCTVTAINREGLKAHCLVNGYTKLDSITLQNLAMDLNEGYLYKLYFTQSPSNATETIYWMSDDSTIASVNQNGEIRGNAPGTTKIHAISAGGGIDTYCTVNVSSPSGSIELSSTTTILKVGSNKKITATLYPTDTTDEIFWDSSDDSIATVNDDGVITALRIGDAIITATTTSGKTAQCRVTVNQPATSIKLNKTAIITYVGSTYQLSSTMLPFDTTDTVTWSSSSTSYATVSNTGLITGVRAGTTTITAKTTSGLTAMCTVTVKPALVEPISIALSDTYITLAPEDAKALIPTFEPSNTTETTLVWTSSDENVAIVDKNGVVTAVSNGFATIRGKTTNGLVSECVVKIVSATGTSVLLDNSKASPGGTAQVKANIVKNPGLSAYKFKVNYDADVLTPVSITPNAEFGGTFSTNLEDADRTELNVLWYSGNDDVVANGELFTVNFKVNDSTAYGDSSIVSIEYGATDVCDVSGNYIAIYTEDATVSIEEPMSGDIYEDSDVNVYDLILLARYITSLETFTERQEEAADVNNDGLVDILDVIRLSQYLVGWSGVELMSLHLFSLDEPAQPVIKVGTASVNESNEAEIPVYIKDNTGILGYRFVLDYNADDIEILSITPSELVNKEGFNHNLGAESQATDGLVVSCYTSGNNVTDDGVLFTVKVRYKNSADTSVSPISIVDNFNNIGDENAAYVTATYETGYALGSDYIVANKIVGDTNFSCELYFDDSYAEQSAKAIIAFYDCDGRMVHLMPKDITVKPGKVDLSIDYDKNAYATYKLMIWEGMNSLKPITDVK